MADAKGAITLSSTTPATTGPLFVTNNLLDPNYGWGLILSTDGTHQLIVDTGVELQVPSFEAPLSASIICVALSYGSGLKVSANTLQVDWTAAEP